MSEQESRQPPRWWQGGADFWRPWASALPALSVSLWLLVLGLPAATAFKGSGGLYDSLVLLWYLGLSFFLCSGMAILAWERPRFLLPPGLRRPAGSASGHKPTPGARGRP